VQTSGFEAFIDGVVVELQDRGRFRREYEYDTLRENLGLGEQVRADTLVNA